MNPYAALGFAQSAGRAVSGDEACTAHLRRGAVRLLIVAEDASPGTARRFAILAERYGAPVIRFGSKAELGRRLGRPDRAVVALLDEGLTEQVLRSVREDLR